MISSSDDLKLLLKKLESESITVGFLGSVITTEKRLALIYMEGHIHMDEENNSFQLTLGPERGPAFAIVDLTGCQCAYSRIEDVPKTELDNLPGMVEYEQRYEDCIVIGRPEEKARVIIMTLRDSPSTL